MPKTLEQGDLKKAHDLYAQLGTWEAVGKELGIPAERARSRARRYVDPNFSKKVCSATNTHKREILKEALKDHGFDDIQEFKAILSSLKGQPPRRKTINRRRAKSHSVKLLVITDTHIGHSKFNYELWDEACKASKDCDLILHPGDHLEGMSNRPGHIYELIQGHGLGFHQQFNHAVELYRQLAEKPIYGIDGNHDGWYHKKSDQGMIVGEALQQSLKNYTHLGQCEGDIHLDGLWIKLFHPNDGTSYATSYKGQKLVESFTGGEKPHIVFEGHYHKALYQFIRNVHQYECGTICGQSDFMRLKKLPAHMGFWEVIVRWNDTGVTSITNTFHPGYE